MRISLHITTRDRHSELALLLQSLRTQTYQNWDLVIIDASQPRLAWESSFVGALLARMKVEGHGVIAERATIAGNCSQRNQAIKADVWNNPLICRLDDDVILEPDYLERLVRVIRYGFDMASGVSPLLGVADFQRELPADVGVINKIVYNTEGDIVEIGDDCGFNYVRTDGVCSAHHLRSCFMYKRELHTVHNLTYETPGRVAFREETEFCIRAAYAGYKMGVDVNAVAWHLASPSGGARTPSYNDDVALGDFAFRRWAKRQYQTRGNPFEGKKQ